MKKGYLGSIISRDVGSIVIRRVGFGVKGWYSDFKGRLYIP